MFQVPIPVYPFFRQAMERGCHTCVMIHGFLKESSHSQNRRRGIADVGVGKFTIASVYFGSALMSVIAGSVSASTTCPKKLILEVNSSDLSNLS